MTKRLLGIIALLVLLGSGGVLYLALYGYSDAESWPPERPEAVPQGAHFVGGLDGWDWVDCSPASDKRLHCTIYDRLGRPNRNVFLTACFNLRDDRENEGMVPEQILEGGIRFNRARFYEYRPFATLSGHAEGVAQKYYRLFGVTEKCVPASAETELIVVDPLR